MGVLKVKQIAKSFNKKTVLSDCTFEVAQNEILALIGESGSGKSTLLRILAGFETPDKGEILLQDKILANDQLFTQPEDRKVAIVFQDYALFPHLTVEQNVLFGAPKAENKKEKLDQLLSIFELNTLRNRKPSQISGGQQQRVAIARAIASEPDLLLLDEPFSNLDQALRKKVRNEIAKIKNTFQLPIILVSHDLEDTIAIADRVAVLQEGELTQLAAPLELYKEPKNLYIAQLFGNAFEWEGKIYRPEHVRFSNDGNQSKIVEITPNIHYNLLLLENGVLLHDVSKKHHLGDTVYWAFVV
jgi:iron(III) transport system ATP-binding protein